LIIAESSFIEAHWLENLVFLWRRVLPKSVTHFTGLGR
jgi:hypothetical protein